MNVLVPRALALAVLWSCLPLGANASEYFLADGNSWPGRLILSQGRTDNTLHQRPRALTDSDVPRLQSVTTLPGGRTVFCSGLDRSVFELAGRGETRLHYGGPLVRQVRTDTDGSLYWSGLETPLDNNPLPDGFIYVWDPARREPRALLTFSQGDLGHDWWGAFDVRDGRIYAGTLRNRTTIYDVSASPVHRVTTLPISATAFRFAADGSLFFCDGRGTLYRIADLNHPEEYEIVLRSPTPFVDFSFTR